MKKLKLDMGMECYKVGEGVLRMNPCDPALYERLLELLEELASGISVSSHKEADKYLRQKLNWLLPGNDFDQIFPGSLLAMCGCGKVLIAEFLESLQPVLLSGARRYAEATQ